MSSAIGKIVRGAHPVAGPTSIRLIPSVVPSSPEWSGQFTLPEGSTADLGPARVVMADGRAGDVVLYRLDAGARRTVVVNFFGVGPLKKAG